MRVTRLQVAGSFGILTSLSYDGDIVRRLWVSSGRASAEVADQFPTFLLTSSQ